MELYYNLLGVYSPDPSVLAKVKKLAEELMESSYIEASDVIELAKNNNSVLLVEEELEDGDMEFIIVNNRGRVCNKVIFSMDETYNARSKIEDVGAEEYFTKTMLKDIDKLAKEYEMSREEFIEDYLSTYYMDLYENKKNKYLDNLKDYFKE